MKIKKFSQLNENKDTEIINEDKKPFGVVNIHIDGEGWIKNHVINEIRKTLRQIQGEKHLFIDEKETNPYSSGGGMG